MYEVITTEEVNSTDLTSYLPEHTKMISMINENYPEIQRATSLFGKSQSQFMDNFLTVTQPTALRSVRQILAEINKSKSALDEAKFKRAKSEVQIKILERDIEEVTDPLKRELIQIKIDQKKSQLENGIVYISGAIRKIANYIEQYNSILKSKNIKEFNEIDFEEDEERYHIMTAFNQGTIAARSRNGIIDEGNHIYFQQIGINGASAQMEVNVYLAMEGKLFKDKQNAIQEAYKSKQPIEPFLEMPEPTHDMYMQFLNNMGDKYKGVSKEYAVYKGMTGEVTELASLKTGDTRLIKQ